MCFWNQPTPPAPTPAPLPPPPPVPEAPKQVLPDPAPIDTEINPKVQRAQSKKARNPNLKGTGGLRIPMKPSVNTGTTAQQAGGLNQ